MPFAVKKKVFGGTSNFKFGQTDCLVTGLSLTLSVVGLLYLTVLAHLQGFFESCLLLKLLSIESSCRRCDFYYSLCSFPPEAFLFRIFFFHEVPKNGTDTSITVFVGYENCW